jgi:alpha-glucosidase
LKAIKYIIGLFILIATTCYCSANNLRTINSPGGKSEVCLEIDNGELYWSVKYQGAQILKKSKLGIISGGKQFQKPFTEVKVSYNSKDTLWQPVWGKFSKIRNTYNEIVWTVKSTSGNEEIMDLIVRAYDDGIAMRYNLHGEGVIIIKDDNTHFSFPEDYTCWSENEWRQDLDKLNLKEFIGPVKLSKFKGYGFPVTIELDKNCYAAVLEAGIYNIAHMKAEKVGSTTLKSTFLPSKVSLPCQTSWRVVQFGETPGDLLTSSILLNLNPPAKIEDTSWIKTGLSLWDWRVWGCKAEDGFVYGLDMASWRRMIDFASIHNIPYLMLDAGWYGLEFDPKSDPTTNRDKLLIQPDPTKPALKYVEPPKNWKDPIDIPALIKYGKERNVGIFLYLNDVIRQNFDTEETLRTYQEWGAAGIKYGFMEGSGQFKVERTREIVELCGKYKLYCNFHDELIPPSGDVTTYPYYLSREFCHSQADGLQSFTPGTYCTMVFTNMLAGPLDMNNGYLTLTDIENDRPKVFKTIHSTIVAEAARVLITYSGLAVLPDSPDSYASKPDLFEFIARLPMTWEDTRILNAEIGKFITTARRSGDEWFVASTCDEMGVTLPVSFDFLDENVEYEATFYEDAPESHFITNKDEYRVKKLKVRQGDVISAKLAPGGGHCIWLRPVR